MSLSVFTALEFNLRSLTVVASPLDHIRNALDKHLLLGLTEN